MFEDLINKKFEGVNTGDRDIATEIQIMILNGIQFGKGEVDQLEPHVEKIVNKWFDKNMDMMVGMYLDEFTADELIEMIDTVRDESYQKKLRFHMKLQGIIMESLLPMMLVDSIDEEEKMDKKEGAGFLQALEDLSLERIDDFYDNDNKIWDAKE